jgi:AraC family transcriptional regulator, regulatory protein of adaptative response / methylated-DNA-[protein]-cysteine methyltransferase
MPEKELSQQWSQDYAFVEKTIHYWTENFRSTPSLDEIAEAVGLSESDLRKLFSRWPGISPEQFLQYLSKAYAKELLNKSGKLWDIDHDIGSINKRAGNSLFIHYETIGSEEYKAKGEGMEIVYGFSSSPFGDCMIANTQHGICSLLFEGESGKDSLIERLQAEWPKASLKKDDQESRYLAYLLFPLPDNPVSNALHLNIKDSDFNIKVWKALLNIPKGHLISYQDIASYIGHPRAARAVGTAIGNNPVSFVIPCHRVIRKNGDFGNYGGGPARKKAMIAWEVSTSD